MLDIIEDFVKHSYTYMRMDGSTSISSRQPLIQQYNNVSLSLAKEQNDAFIGQQFHMSH